MSKKYSFLNGEVIVTVLTDKPKKLKAVKLDDLGNPDMNPSSGDFKPIRVVANIVLEEDGKPGEYLTDLEQMVEIKIRYTKADKAAADALNKPLALGFWDGTRWVRFTPEKHGFTLLPDVDLNKGGVGKISISKWGDPPSSWGV
jgi:hypothetical protein